MLSRSYTITDPAATPRACSNPRRYGNEHRAHAPTMRGQPLIVLATPSPMEDLPRGRTGSRAVPSCSAQDKKRRATQGRRSIRLCAIAALQPPGSAPRQNGFVLMLPTPAELPDALRGGHRSRISPCGRGESGELRPCDRALVQKPATRAVQPGFPSCPPCFPAPLLLCACAG